MKQRGPIIVMGKTPEGKWCYAHMFTTAALAMDWIVENIGTGRWVELSMSV